MNSIETDDETMKQVVADFKSLYGLLTPSEKAYIDNLKSSAKDGVYFRDSLTSEVLRLSAAVQPEITRDTMECITKSLSVAQLTELKTAFENKLGESVMPKPQLFGQKNKNNSDNKEFSI